jgi:UDP-GlcNAc:undecaprenyl-phosphate/decaprenyl-phosphate GlcNAc-1-phosphate transferase
MISALSLRACSAGPNTAVSLLTLAALLTLPLLDVVTALGRRGLTGRSIFTPDRGHIHHCLRSRLGSTTAALGAAIGLATLGAGGAALAKAHGSGDPVACLAIVSSVGLLVSTNTFGCSESRLLFFRLRTALASLLKVRAARQRGIRQECHLHGIRDWAGVWDALIRAAEAMEVQRVELSIDMAAAGEVYHGLWCAAMESEEGPNWSVVHTLHARGVPAGILRVAGSAEARQTRYLDQVEQLVRVLEGHLEFDAPAPVPATVPAPPFVNLPVSPSQA